MTFDGNPLYRKFIADLRIVYLIRSHTVYRIYVKSTAVFIEFFTEKFSIHCIMVVNIDDEKNYGVIFKKLLQPTKPTVYEDRLCLKVAFIQVNAVYSVIP